MYQLPAAQTDTVEECQLVVWRRPAKQHQAGQAPYLSSRKRRGVHDEFQSFDHLVRPMSSRLSTTEHDVRCSHDRQELIVPRSSDD